MALLLPTLEGLLDPGVEGYLGADSSIATGTLQRLLEA